ncbi:hypothetical protein AAF712_000778 [Marasmius tenuissimus]|uniref:Isochorismatase-like domain-containing protein n=1 Tax=Marasmius tenuissimus TaxID=585030 RepID=A0ABR3AD33_9AGAR
MSVSSVPLHDTPILGMVNRPLVQSPIQYGASASFWVEYPTGLIDLTCKHPLLEGNLEIPQRDADDMEIAVEGGRTLRVDSKVTALVVIDMQKNWGLTDTEVKTIPPALIRGFRKSQSIRGGGFGSKLPGDFGRLLVRGERNSDLYGPLQDEFIKGQQAGADVWIHKNRMSALWDQTALDLFLKENGLKTLLFAGVNTDQCVGGTLIDAYYRGYDCILLQDATATTSPTGGFENVVYNAGNSYGFVTDTARVIAAQ